MSSASTLKPLATVPWRQDASLMGLVGLAHMVSHFSQLLLAPLFPWLKDAFQVSYAELGLLMTLFFVVSCTVQTLSGFWVDRYGPRPVLLAGLGLIAVAVYGFALSTHYSMLALWAVLAGAGNGVFHPVDYTLLNRKVSASRLGHAYSVHGITGSLGWALAPALLVPLAAAFSWRLALGAAGLLITLVWCVLWWHRQRLALPQADPRPQAAATGSGPGREPPAAGGTAGLAGARPRSADNAHWASFLRIPSVWTCFGFFFMFAASLSVVQAFAPEAARQLHAVPVTLVAVCLSIYMVASASGMVLGGFLATDPARGERVVATGFALAASVALALGLAPIPSGAVPLLFGIMGFSAGIAGPSRDLLVKRSTPEHATGRVVGVVYSGLDIGQAVSPLVFGLLMDHGAYRSVFVGLALVMLLLVLSGFSVRRVRRTAVAAPV